METDLSKRRMPAQHSTKRTWWAPAMGKDPVVVVYGFFGLPSLLMDALCGKDDRAGALAVSGLARHQAAGPPIQPERVIA